MIFCRTPSGLEDVSKYPALFVSLLATGSWSVDDLKKVAGLNFLRVFREVENVSQIKSTLLYAAELLPRGFAKASRAPCGGPKFKEGTQNSRGKTRGFGKINASERHINIMVVLWLEIKHEQDLLILKSNKTQGKI